MFFFFKSIEEVWFNHSSRESNLESLGSTVRLFEDNSLLYMTIRSQADTKILQSDLKKLEHWDKSVQKKWLQKL